MFLARHYDGSSRGMKPGGTKRATSANVCHFCACRARRGNSQCLAKSSPFAGPSAGSKSHVHGGGTIGVGKGKTGQERGGQERGVVFPFAARRPLVNAFRARRRNPWESRVKTLSPLPPSSSANRAADIYFVACLCHTRKASARRVPSTSVSTAGGAGSL